MAAVQSVLLKHVSAITNRVGETNQHKSSPNWYELPYSAVATTVMSRVLYKRQSAKSGGLALG
jgi:hypothetical protein